MTRKKNQFCTNRIRTGKTVHIRYFFNIQNSNLICTAITAIACFTVETYYRGLVRGVGALAFEDVIKRIESE